MRAAPPTGERGGDHEPNESLAADPRQAFEHRVEPADPMVDGPALEPAVVAQAGSSCLACSISCCGSNGLPTKACAPRAVACSADRSLTLPLHITTGLAPTPCRSWT